MISSTCSIRWRLSPRPDPTFSFAAERSDGQGWPKAIAKRLALDGREHSGQICGIGRPIPVAVSFRTCFVARFNVANYDDTEGSSPSGASIAPQTCIRSIREDRNHDAVMRIGGEGVRRHAIRKPGERPPAPRPNSKLATRLHMWGATSLARQAIAA